ncbi:hypothetical protein [Chlamydiifrater volucris]|uniref:hypothetical protein n=1 Tax=Chlamydiifrater volucris TaxID=2681470 RepID=UPI001BD09653|nr:hypothetical protein [Chlamydiifrater volucris]
MKVFSNKNTSSLQTDSSVPGQPDIARENCSRKRVLSATKRFFLEVLPKLAIISLVVLSMSLAIAYCSVGTLVGAISLGYLMLSSAIAGIWISKKMHKKESEATAAKVPTHS